MLKNISNLMLFIIKIFWQLPQIILGYIVLLFNLKYINFEKSLYYKGSKIYIMSNESPITGVCYWEKMILVRGNKNVRTRIRHEYGHSRQSIMLGPLYLFLVGIPSTLRVLWFRRDKKNRDYYGGYPENWADKLGGVKRK